MQPFIPWRSMVVCAAVIALAGVISAIWARSKTESMGEKLAVQLEHRGKVIVVRELASLPHTIEGTRLVGLSAIPEIERALSGTDSSALAHAMGRNDSRTLFISHDSTPPKLKLGSLLSQLFHRHIVSGLRGVYLSPAADVFESEKVDLIDEKAVQSLLVVARGILEGQPPPRLSSFPETLRKTQSLEVLITLREHGAMRLWRSARATSLARGIIAAATDARRRWEERRSYFGGPLSERIARIEVSVELLVDDGTLSDSSESFLRSVVTTQHGLAAEYKGQWRYLLPADVHSYASLQHARTELLHELRLKSDGEQAHNEIRFYRIYARPLIAHAQGAMQSSL